MNINIEYTMITNFIEILLKSLCILWLPIHTYTYYYLYVIKIDTNDSLWQYNLSVEYVVVWS